MSRHVTSEQIRRLYSNIGKLIISQLDPDEVIKSVMFEIKNFFDPENWSLLRLDEASNELFFVVVEGIDAAAVEGIRLQVGEGIAGQVALTGESIFVADASKDKRFTSKVDDASGFKTKSIMAVPIKFQDKILGLIEVINRNDGEPFEDEELVVLETIADFTAIALTNAMLYQSMIQVSERDPLTGVYNRQKLEYLTAGWDLQKTEHRRESDQHSYLSVYLLDLNDFKIVNDTEGHAAGDRILRNMSQALNSCARDEEMVFRIGGDEFLMLAFHQNEVTMRTMEQDLLQRLQKISLDLKPGMGQFSIGVASGECTDYKKLMDVADASMYEDKKIRKNGRVR